MIKLKLEFELIRAIIYNYIYQNYYFKEISSYNIKKLT